MIKPTSPEPKCPACKKTLTEPADYDNAKQELERKVNQVHLELSKQEKKEFDMSLADIRTKHRTELQRLRARFRHQEAAHRKKSNDYLKTEKGSHKQKLEALRRDNQISLQQTRELYETKNLIAQKEREGLFNNQLREIIQNYSNLSSNYQKELERLRKVQDDYGAMIRKVEAEVARLKINIVRSTADPQIARLMIQLEERDATIDDLRSKVTELEAKLLARAPPAKTATTVPPVASATPIQIGIKEQGAINISETSDNVPKTENKPLIDNNIDPRELFIGAIKEINRNLKRPIEKSGESKENDAGGEDPLGRGATITTSDKDSSGPDAGSTKSAKLRKWFS